MDVRAYAAPAPSAPLEPFVVSRRDVGPRDVAIDIKYAGICHSDIHQAREEWFTSIFPMVPGHEIAGIVTAVGSEVTSFAIGDRVGVGCYVDSCGECKACRLGQQSYCTGHVAPTYNGLERDNSTPTYGGYSTHIVVDAGYVLRLPDSLGLDVAAPLLCAGITTYQPLAEWNAGPGVRVGIVGLGGLGHMGVKIAAAMGSDVTLISHSPGKEEDGHRLGATSFILSSDKPAMKAARHSLDLIINTASAVTSLDPYLQLLDLDGTLVTVGLPDSALTVSAFNLIAARRRLAGTNNGGIPQTQEMLDFCGTHGLGSDIETIAVQQVNEAWDRVVASDVKYRFVIDTASLDD
jgi:alcohol dehydrogenase (NADP+)